MRFSGREIAAALGAYAFTVLPQVRRELRRWGPLPREKAKNAEAVAVFATLAPRPARAGVLRAIVALQVAIDLRDVGEETGGATTPSELALLERLEEGWRREVAVLPSHRAIEPSLERAVERCKEGQRRTHAAATGEVEALRAWALTLESAPGYRWWEVAAGASSSVDAHALIAAAADPDTTAATAAAVDAAYQPPLGALTVLLDDLVDREEDRAAGEHNYLGYYASAVEAAQRLGLIADRAEELLSRLPGASRHRAILTGVGAYYLSAAATETPYAQPIRSRLIEALGPGAGFLTALLRLLRLGERKRPGQAGNSPGP